MSRTPWPRSTRALPRHGLAAPASASWAWPRTGPWRCVTASQAPAITASAASRRGSTAIVRRASSQRITSRRRRTATAAGLARCVPEAAITRRTRATAPLRTRTFTTASGSGAGLPPVWRSTAGCPSGIRAFSRASTTEDGYEAPHGGQPQGESDRAARGRPWRGWGETGCRGCRGVSGHAPAAAGSTRRSGLLLRVLPGMGGGQERWHRGTLPAGRARSVRLPSGLLLAGAGAGPAQPRPRLDGPMRRCTKGLAQDRPRVPVRAAVLLFIAAVAASAAAEGPVSGGGRGTLYMSARPGRILVADEASFRIVGEIPLPNAQPGISYPLRLSQDKRRFLSFGINLEDIEIVDIASRRVVDTVRLSEGNRQVRLDGEGGCADRARFLALAIRTTTKLVDRFEIGPKTLVEYDLEKKAVGRTIPWPKDQEREGAGLLYSPDGKLLYVIADDVFIYETSDLKLVDKWELSRPLEDGFGRLQLGDLDDVNEEPGFFTGLFETDDPIQHRKLMGIARLDLAGKTADFWAVGPAQEMRQCCLAPGRRKADSTRK